ncbi:MAG: RsmD family RNA methyltransferase [Candidatus Latescibacterota bacterium]|nr:MAG: RsmD family RNA methyltransferase [Candidatus Latescibacterota bacterium]
MARTNKKQIRVIAGSLKGRMLEYPVGTALRPTMQRTKAAVFDSLGDALHDTVFVDLFAAAGGVGIEALSRGARVVHFVERDGYALACLESNLKRCDIGSDQSVVHTADVMAFLRDCRLFDHEPAIVYADPPYEFSKTGVFLEFFGRMDYAYFPLLILEHRSNAIPDDDPPGLARVKLKRFGQSWVSFFVSARGE